MKLEMYIPPQSETKDYISLQQKLKGWNSQLIAYRSGGFKETRLNQTVMFYSLRAVFLLFADIGLLTILNRKQPQSKQKTILINESFNSSSSNNSARKINDDNRLSNFYNDAEELKILGK